MGRALDSKGITRQGSTGVGGRRAKARPAYPWHQMRWAVLVALFVPLLLAACLPLPIGTDGTPARAPSALPDPNSSVAISTDGEQWILAITSDTGIGTVEVSMPSESTQGLLIQLSVAGLEELRFGYENIEVVASVSSTEEDAIIQSLSVESGAGEPIDESSSYWIDIKLVSETGGPAAIPMTEGLFQITPPPDLVQRGSSSFTMRWIDFFR